MRRHPSAIAWDRFREQYPDLFVTKAEGVYLQNRLRHAYEAGWFDAAERAHTALSKAMESPQADAAVDPHADASDARPRATKSEVSNVQ